MKVDLTFVIARKSMIVLTVSDQQAVNHELIVPATSRHKLSSSKVITAALSGNHNIVYDDGSSNQKVTIPLPDSYYWAIKHSYFNWLQGRGCRLDKAYKLAHCLKLANFLEDDDYFNYNLNFLLQRWLYRDLANKVLSQLSDELVETIYLRIPHPILPEHLRHNEAFMVRWLQRNLPETASSYGTGLCRADFKMSLASDDFNTLVIFYNNNDGCGNNDGGYENGGCEAFWSSLIYGRRISAYKVTTNMDNQHCYQKYSHRCKLPYPKIRLSDFKDNTVNHMNFTTAYYSELITDNTAVSSNVNSTSQRVCSVLKNVASEYSSITYSSTSLDVHLTGVCRAWYKNGNLQRQTDHKFVMRSQAHSPDPTKFPRSLLHGTDALWSNDGQVKHTIKYRCNKLVSN